MKENSERYGSKEMIGWEPTGHRVLVTGGTGLVGSGIVRAMLGKEQVISVSRGQMEYAFDKSESLGVVRFDLLSGVENIEKLLKEKAPTIVIHCAAKADVDACQREQKDAWEQNVIATRNLAWACKKLGIVLAFCSTDSVFPIEGGPFSESQARWPIWKDGILNYYSWTKIEAEEQVEKILGRDKSYFIFRVAFPYDPTYTRKTGTPVSAFWALAKGEEWTVVKDMTMTPTRVPWIAIALNRLIAERVWEDEEPIYHIAGPEILTAEGVAEICVAELEGRGISVDRGKIKSTTADEFFKSKVPRQTGGGVTTEKIQALGIKIPSLCEEVKRFALPEGQDGSSL